MIDLENAIRSAVADIVAAAPEPQRTLTTSRTPGRPHQRHHRDRRRVALAATLVVVVALATIVILRNRPEATFTATPTTSEGPAGTSSETLNGYPVVDAIATLDPSGVIELNRGADDGLRVGMTVVDDSGVVGKIAQVSAATSVLLRADDPGYAIECTTAAPSITGEAGSCTGNGNGTQLIRTTSGGAAAGPGARVQTAGGPDSLAPAGFLLGTIATNSTTVVDLAADLDAIHDVRIIMYVPTASDPTTTSAADVVPPTAPLITMNSASWSMQSIQDRGPDGEATFTDGTLRIDLFWSGPDDRALWADETENSTLGRATTIIDGSDADVLYRTGYTAAVWSDQRYTLRVRMDSVDDGTFEATIALLTTVSEDEWIAALPPDVVRPVDRATTIRSILSDVELPPGLDVETLAATPVVGTYGQLGLAVTEAAVCGWVGIWLDATDANDTAAVDVASAALAGSHEWNFLQQYPSAADTLWNYADAANGGMISGGSQPFPLTRESAGSCS